MWVTFVRDCNGLSRLYGESRASGLFTPPFDRHRLPRQIIQARQPLRMIGPILALSQGNQNHRSWVRGKCAWNDIGFVGFCGTDHRRRTRGAGRGDLLLCSVDVSGAEQSRVRRRAFSSRARHTRTAGDGGRCHDREASSQEAVRRLRRSIPAPWRPLCGRGRGRFSSLGLDGP